MIVDKDTLATLGAAAKSPEAYVSGSERQKLRAAFDFACSQITNHTLGFESQNRMMLRAKLNSLAVDEIPKDYSKLITILKKALKSAEPLYSSKAYQDDENEDIVQMRKFAKQGLKPLVDCIEQFA